MAQNHETAPFDSDADVGIGRFLGVMPIASTMTDSAFQIHVASLSVFQHASSLNILVTSVDQDQLPSDESSEFMQEGRAAQLKEALALLPDKLTTEPASDRSGHPELRVRILAEESTELIGNPAISHSEPGMWWITYLFSGTVSNLSLPVLAFERPSVRHASDRTESASEEFTAQWSVPISLDQMIATQVLEDVS